VADAQGAWSFGVTWTNGLHTFTATDTDAAGNTSIASAPMTIAARQIQGTSMPSCQARCIFFWGDCLDRLESSGNSVSRGPEPGPSGPAFREAFCAGRGATKMDTLQSPA